MPIYQFRRESYVYYRLYSENREDALKILKEALEEDLSDNEADLEKHYDRTETCMDFEFAGEWPDNIKTSI